jgi:3-deoxy-manno-octulosonate cytidylyltransferase (CMP-KDO synthetase)
LNPVRVAGIIPARYASSRFDGKALALIEGKTLISRVYEKVLSSRCLNELIVATDDSRIVHEVESFGGKVALTSVEHKCGTERIAEVAKRIDADIVVNIQGDELLSCGEMIDECVSPLLRDSSLDVSTLAVEIKDRGDVANPNVVKVVRALNGDALFFSRSPVPNTSFLPTVEVTGGTGIEAGVSAGVKPGLEATDEVGVSAGVNAGAETRVGAAVEGRVTFLRHVGIYGFRRQFLLDFVRLAQTPLELAESLEQLRILEHGHRIAVVLTNHSCVGVDVPSDIKKAVAFLVSLERAGA